MQIIPQSALHDKSIAVVIPCYRCKEQILRVVEAMPSYVSRVYVIDDSCPESTGDFVEKNSSDRRVLVLRHSENQGVGGAVMTGYKRALADGYSFAVKIDGDGQMDPRLMPKFLSPLLLLKADYAKGNRFFNPDDVRGMPIVRLFGNAVLSFMTKLSSGYWNVFDPTNGYTAIRTSVLNEMSLDKIQRRYFFESDMLFRLHLAQAVVIDVPMKSHYADERSNLSVVKVIPSFLWRHSVNFHKRIFYEYFLRNFSLASMELVLGLVLFLAGIIFGAMSWYEHAQANQSTPAGTVMLSVFPALVGFQLLLGFLNADVNSAPQQSRFLEAEFE